MPHHHDDPKTHAHTHTHRGLRAWIVRAREQARHLDTREAASSLLHHARTPVWRAILKLVACVGFALGLAYGPQHQGLSAAGHHALFILLLASALWVSEAIATFAVGLTIIALNVALLGNPRGPFAPGNTTAWVRFVAPWGDPLIWLFLGGFVLAAAASKVGLDRRCARWVLGRAGGSMRRLLAAVMGMTFVLSMFMSNTATAAMMLAMLAPLLRAERERAAPLALGVAIAANLGGMGTIIGTPPNAIAAGALGAGQSVSFARWVMLGAPPALLLATLMWAFLCWRYPTRAPLDAEALARALDGDPAEEEDEGDDGAPHQPTPAWHAPLVLLVLLITITAWLTSSLHGIPTPVVAIMPIALLTSARVLDAHDMRGLSWDVLLLLAGGLSLGVAVSETGVAAWLVEALPIEALGGLGVAVALAYLTGFLSNIMSNTAAANILIPITLAAVGTSSAHVVVAVALAASSAMCLPVSTPPNAIAYGTGALTTRDLLVAGLLLGALAPGLCLGWIVLVS